MRRQHLFEFEDQHWLPSFLRNYMTDFLQFLANQVTIYAPAIPIIEEGLLRSGTSTIIDLGSGGGGGLLHLERELGKRFPDLEIVLTDLYPNLSAFKYIKGLGVNFSYERSPVDARDVQIRLKGLRTQFLSLHHFRPEDARKILQNAVDSDSPIAIVEAQERSLPAILGMLLSPISVLVTTPFIRPFRFGRIIFTYLLPLVPLLVLWDGIVSCLRTYSVGEMEELIEGLKNNGNYDWAVGRIKSGAGVVLYLLGTLKQKGR